MILKSLEERFKEPIKNIKVGDETIGVLKLNGIRGVVVFTTDLGKYRMPVPSKYENEAHIELYFLLPDYWEDTLENELFTWSVNRLIAIKNYIKSGAWAISGNTFSFGELPASRFKQRGFSALLLMDPIAIDEFKTPVKLGENLCYFKGLTPVFSIEKDVKEARGMNKFIQRIMDKGMTEKLDEFREPIIKPRFLFWR